LDDEFDARLVFAAYRLDHATSIERRILGVQSSHGLPIRSVNGTWPPTRQQGIIYTRTGGDTPLLTLTHIPQTVLPHWGVYCSSGAFVHSVGFYALVSWAIPTYSRCWCV